MVSVALLYHSLSKNKRAGLQQEKTSTQNVYWSFQSEQRDLNPRPPRPERGALPTALCPENAAAYSAAALVGDERIELPQVESESTALPLCKSPIFGFVAGVSTADKGYYTTAGIFCQPFFRFFYMDFFGLFFLTPAPIGNTLIVVDYSPRVRVK